MWAAEARRSHDWDQTAVLWVAIAEPNRNKDRHPSPFTVNDIHPYPKKPKPKAVAEEQRDAVSIKELRPMFKAMGVKGA